VLVLIVLGWFWFVIWSIGTAPAAKELPKEIQQKEESDRNSSNVACRMNTDRQNESIPNPWHPW